eukprot:7040182-Pyramimonas_sp.AAC.1
MAVRLLCRFPPPPWLEQDETLWLRAPVLAMVPRSGSFEEFHPWPEGAPSYAQFTRDRDSLFPTCLVGFWFSFLPRRARVSPRTP